MEVAFKTVSTVFKFGPFSLIKSTAIFIVSSSGRDIGK